MNLMIINLNQLKSILPIRFYKNQKLFNDNKLVRMFRDIVYRVLNVNFLQFRVSVESKEHLYASSYMDIDNIVYYMLFDQQNGS